MKKSLLIVAVACAVLTSCKGDDPKKDNGTIEPLVNTDIDIYVVDQYGNNLLDPNNANAIDVSQIRTFTYQYAGGYYEGGFPLDRPPYQYGYNLSPTHLTFFGPIGARSGWDEYRIQWTKDISDVLANNVTLNTVDGRFLVFTKEFRVNGIPVYKQTDPGESFHSDRYSFTKVIVCSEDESAYVNTDIHITVIDQHGNNLLDPKSPNAIDVSKLRVFKDETDESELRQIDNPFVKPQYGYEVSENCLSLRARGRVRIAWDGYVNDLFDVNFINKDNRLFIKDFSVNGKLIYQQTDPNEIFHAEPYTYTRVILR